MHTESAKTQRNSKKLDNRNHRNYLLDLEYVGGLPIPESRKQWVEARMYELRASATYAEINMADILIRHQVKFIHQCPFVFDGKIYFADFFIPDRRLVIEVDGEYHYENTQRDKDRARDIEFKSRKIDVVRVSNNETKDAKRLFLRLSRYLK